VFRKPAELHVAWGRVTEPGTARASPGP
jgi:hypothetical protein